MDEKIYLDVILAELEKSYVIKALQDCGGNRKKAARALNISFRSIRYRIQKYDLGGLK